MYIPYTTNGTAIYAAPLTPLAPPMPVPLVVSGYMRHVLKRWPCSQVMGATLSVDRVLKAVKHLPHVPPGGSGDEDGRL